MRAQHILDSQQLTTQKNRASVVVAGLVTVRQRPASAKGKIFLLLEDEFEFMNVLVSPTLADRHNDTVKYAPFFMVQGRFEREGAVIIQTSDCTIVGNSRFILDYYLLSTDINVADSFLYAANKSDHYTPASALRCARPALRGFSKRDICLRRSQHFGHSSARIGVRTYEFGRSAALRNRLSDTLMPREGRRPE